MFTCSAGDSLDSASWSWFGRASRRGCNPGHILTPAWAHGTSGVEDVNRGWLFTRMPPGTDAVARRHFLRLRMYLLNADCDLRRTLKLSLSAVPAGKAMVTGSQLLFHNSSCLYNAAIAIFSKVGQSLSQLYFNTLMTFRCLRVHIQGL